MHPERLPDYEAKLKSYFQEHRHTNEETSYCLEGSGTQTQPLSCPTFPVSLAHGYYLVVSFGEGYYDVRDKNDCWIRIALKKGGMIVIPAGIYHRFTLDTSNYIKVNNIQHVSLALLGFYVLVDILFSDDTRSTTKEAQRPPPDLFISMSCTLLPYKRIFLSWCLVLYPKNEDYLE